MPYKDKAKQKEYQRTHNRLNRQNYLASKRSRQKRNLDFVNNFKSLSSCVICGEDDVGVLDLHHRDPTDKLFEVSVLCRRVSSLDVLQNEIAKCDVVCRNCHRTTYGTGRNKNTTNRQIRIKQIKDVVDGYKTKVGCLKCNEVNPIKLDFHHRDQSTKFKTISRMLAQEYSLKTIMKEIEKCDVLCANCHTKYHRNGY